MKGKATEGNGTYYHSAKQIARSAGMCCACDSKGIKEVDIAAALSSAAPVKVETALCRF
jgi:hypothetical protein